MLFDLAQITVVADVIPDPVLVHIGVLLRFTRELFNHFKRFEDRAGIRFPATDVVNFAATWRIEKCKNQVGNVLRVYVVTNLFALISKYLVLTLLDVAAHQIT